MIVPPLKYMFKNGHQEIEVALSFSLLTQTYLIKRKERSVQKNYDPQHVDHISVNS